jgi:hypothetical protein
VAHALAIIRQDGGRARDEARACAPRMSWC